MDREALMKRLERVQNSRSNRDHDITGVAAAMSDETLRRHVERHERLEAERGDTEEEKAPAAGPHAKPELTNPEATPGAGVLPNSETKDVDGGAG